MYAIVQQIDGFVTVVGSQRVYLDLAKAQEEYLQLAQQWYAEVAKDSIVGAIPTWAINAPILFDFGNVKPVYPTENITETFNALYFEYCSQVEKVTSEYNAQVTAIKADFDAKVASLILEDKSQQQIPPSS